MCIRDSATPAAWGPTLSAYVSPLTCSVTVPADSAKILSLLTTLACIATECTVTARSVCSSPPVPTRQARPCRVGSTSVPPKGGERPAKPATRQEAYCRRPFLARTHEPLQGTTPLRPEQERRRR